MTKNKFRYCWKVMFVFLIAFNLVGCDLFNLDDDEDKDADPDVYKTKPFVFAEPYNLIKVPVPEGGISFPAGINDDDTSRVEKAYYIGEAIITNALWDTVARWALERDYGYYYGLYHQHHENYDLGYASGKNWIERFEAVFGPDIPVTENFGVGHNNYLDIDVSIDAFYIVPIWCNAFTEWYNEKNGTNLIPVYQDSYGNPIRYISNSENFYETANPYATGFRLPTADEWEFAARWNGSSGSNCVTETINGINFYEQTVKFTKGASASGAQSYGDYEKVTVNGYYLPKKVKTKQPNALGLYDMSGNVWERTSSWETRYMNSLNPNVYHTQCRGGAVDSSPADLAVGKIFWVRETLYGSQDNVGFRIARNAE